MERTPDIYFKLPDKGSMDVDKELYITAIDVDESNFEFLNRVTKQSYVSLDDVRIVESIISTKPFASKRICGEEKPDSDPKFVFFNGINLY